MPVSGLVLITDPRATESLARRLADRSGVTVGPIAGPRIPIVVESDTVEDDRSTFAWLDGLEGVTSVELAYMDFSDVPRITSPDMRRMGHPSTRRGKQWS